MDTKIDFLLKIKREYETLKTISVIHSPHLLIPNICLLIEQEIEKLNN